MSEYEPGVEAAGKGALDPPPGTPGIVLYVTNRTGGDCYIGLPPTVNWNNPGGSTDPRIPTGTIGRAYIATSLFGGGVAATCTFQRTRGSSPESTLAMDCPGFGSNTATPARLPGGEIAPTVTNFNQRLSPLYVHAEVFIVAD